MRIHRRRERGSATLEVAIVAPVMLAFIALILLGGRIAVSQQAIQAAANAAARAASISRSAGEADSAASAGVARNLANQGINCVDVQVNVDTTDFSLPVGTPGTVTVEVRCAVVLTDLPLGITSFNVQAAARSPLDTYRERG